MAARHSYLALNPRASGLFALQSVSMPGILFPFSGSPCSLTGRRQRARAPGADATLPWLLALWLLPALACPGAGPSYLAAVVADADSGVVLHAQNANRRVRPASLTKLMTALLVMEHLAGGAAAEGEWPVSARAAGQPAVRLGLRSGRAIPVSTVLDAVLVVSANDAAVVAAEALAGSESAFVDRMNAAAKRLGLGRTRFDNASGLPAPQATTARDMAVLARHLWRAFPAQRGRYAQSGMTYAGRWLATTNRLIGSYQGARGMKTGFTCRAGFNMVAAAERRGRTLIAVVLGARTRAGRDRAIRNLLDEAFAGKTSTPSLTVEALQDARGQGDGLPVSVAIIARTCVQGQGPSGWNIEVGVKRTEKEARAVAREFIGERVSSLRGARAVSIPRYTGVGLHRAIVTGLNQDRARQACLAYRQQGGFCIIFGPDAASRQLEEAARIRTLAEEYRASARKRTPVERRSD